MASLLPRRTRRNKLILSPVFWAMAFASLVLDLGAQTKPKPRTPPETVAALQSRIRWHVSKPQFSAAVWGIKVVSLETGRTVYEHNPDKLLNPASCAKLLTAALALDQFGPHHRIQTSLFAAARPSAKGALKGDLVLYGRGDPCFSPSFTPAPATSNSLLAPLLQQISKGGIKRIQGDVIADESFFSGASLGSGWAWDDLPYAYGAPVSSLTFHDNTAVMRVTPGGQIGAPCKITFTPSPAFNEIVNRTKTSAKGTPSTIRWNRSPGQNSIAITGELPTDSPGYASNVAAPQPAAMFLQHLYESLLANGVKITGKPRLLSSNDSMESIDIRGKYPVELAAAQSRPMGEIIEKMLKNSQNLYAQLLLLQAGEKHRAASEPALDVFQKTAGTSPAAAPTARAGLKETRESSEAMGLEAMQGFLGRAGIHHRQFFLEEGAGLSRATLASSEALVALLRFMDKHPHRETFRGALPIAGIDGTLRNRLRQGAAQGNVRAKTGSMRFVESLSGYVTTQGKERLAFAILLNNYHPASPGKSARDEVDTLVLLLAQFTGRSEAALPPKRRVKP